MRRAKAPLNPHTLAASPLQPISHLQEPGNIRNITPEALVLFMKSKCVRLTPYRATLQASDGPSHHPKIFVMCLKFSMQVSIKLQTNFKIKHQHN